MRSSNKPYSGFYYQAPRADCPSLNSGQSGHLTFLDGLRETPLSAHIQHLKGSIDL